MSAAWSMPPPGPEREAWRQRRLAAALLDDAQADAELLALLRPWPRLPDGLGAYRANAQAQAARALGQACPTVAALVGEPGWAALAWDLWRHDPPVDGDLGCWGQGLPDWLQQHPLCDEAGQALPWLADLARLDLAVQACERAVDGPAATPDLRSLADADPAACTLSLRPGSRLLASPWVLDGVWQAHRLPDDQRAEALGQLGQLGQMGGLGALGGSGGFGGLGGLGGLAPAVPTATHHLLVWRRGAAARLQRLDAADAAFTAALIAGLSLAAAMDQALAAAPAWSFERWLLPALQQGWIAALSPVETPPKR